MSQLKKINIDKVLPDRHNANAGTENGQAILEKSIDQYGAGRSILLDKNNEVIAGNKTLQALADAGFDELIVIETDGRQAVAVRRSDLDLSDQNGKARELAYVDNQAGALGLEWSPSVLLADIEAGLNLEEWFSFEELKDILGDDYQPSNAGAGNNAGNHAKLTDKFLVPPFSVLDTRQGYWRERRAKWLALGIKSELGREVAVYSVALDYENYGRTEAFETQSIFDPVLCELVYRWFSPVGAQIIDPFAGGSVRGIVAGATGREYHGIELSETQVVANREQVKVLHIVDHQPTIDDPHALTPVEKRTILDASAPQIAQIAPVWINGDSAQIKEIAPLEKYDLIFSCPPYGNLEVYSDQPGDISNLDYDQFMKQYRAIIADSADLLREDRFAVFVVANYRDDHFMRDLVGDTVKAFEAAGLFLYNEAILVNNAGSLPIRVSRQFPISRKLGKQHQQVLIFLKGDWRKATEFCGHVAIELPEDMQED